MSTDLERLNIILAVRDREFAKQMERNQRRMERFAKQATRDMSRTSRSFDLAGAAAKRLAPLLAAVGAGAVLSKIRATVSELDDIGKTADKIGLTTDALQELRTVAESAGISQSSLDSSMERFNKRLGEASLGSGAAAKMLDQMGLEAEELATMGLDQALSVVADRIAAIPEPTQRAAAAAALFGREGVAMVNLLREGSAGMETMRQEARDLGIILDESIVRGAEDAQTKLDLMGRVISAQLNAALIDLAPLLVGGATAIADMARMLNSAIDAVQNFLRPQTQLQEATDNVVAAMADEIRQSQLLDTALNRGIAMSQAAARAKLEEARTRHENAKAAIAEQRAMVVNSDEWQDLTKQINSYSDALMSAGFHGDKATAINAAGFEETQQSLAAVITRRQELLKVNDELQAQVERTGQNTARLEAAIGQSGGGTVSINGDVVQPIDPSNRKEIDKTRAATSQAKQELADYADVMDRVKQAFGDNANAASGYTAQLQELQTARAQGVLTEQEYASALRQVENQFDRAKQAAETMGEATTSALASIVTGSQSASDALSGLLSNFATMFAKAGFQQLLGGTGLFTAMSALTSFDGGGHTGSGPRTGGLDGKGGFLAMVHPNESIIDHTRTGGGAPALGRAADKVNIKVEVNGARGNSEIMDMVQAGVRQGLGHYDRRVLPRRVQEVNRDPRRTQ